MALRNLDPFAKIPGHLEVSKNPYLAYFRSHESQLPIKHGPDLATLPGRWSSQFASPHHDLILEIGCHLGKTIIEMAQHNPQRNFIGFDITFKRVATTAQRAKRRQLANIQTALVNAQFIDNVFGKDELDGVCVFFPDPWSKARKEKHRLLTDIFAKKVYSVLKPGGFFWIKTDQRPYYNAANTAIDTAGFKPADATCAFLRQRYETTFEHKFKEQGLPTFSAQWMKPTHSSSPSSISVSSSDQK